MWCELSVVGEGSLGCDVRGVWWVRGHSRVGC